MVLLKHEFYIEVRRAWHLPACGLVSPGVPLSAPATAQRRDLRSARL